MKIILMVIKKMLPSYGGDSIVKYSSLETDLFESVVRNLRHFQGEGAWVVQNVPKGLYLFYATNIASPAKTYLDVPWFPNPVYPGNSTPYKTGCFSAWGLFPFPSSKSSCVAWCEYYPYGWESGLVGNETQHMSLFASWQSSPGFFSTQGYFPFPNGSEWTIGFRADGIYDSSTGTWSGLASPPADYGWGCAGNCPNPTYI